VFLDAVVVRMVLLPAVLEFLGRRTWAFPRGLDRRLPRLAIEPSAHPAYEERRELVAPGRVFVHVGDVVAAARKAVRAPSSAASSGSIDSIICVRSRPPCRAAKVDSASARGFA
jgi:hypothetical protein